jgi:hypothetical protein
MRYTLNRMFGKIIALFRDYLLVIVAFANCLFWNGSDFYAAI